MEVPQEVYTNLISENIQMRTLLRASREKLALYRAQHSGEYVGGIEYTTLVREIDAILSSSPKGGTGGGGVSHLGHGAGGNVGWIGDVQR